MSEMWTVVFGVVCFVLGGACGAALISWAHSRPADPDFRPLPGAQPGGPDWDPPQYRDVKPKPKTMWDRDQ